MRLKGWTPAWLAHPLVGSRIGSQKTAVMAVGLVALIFGAQMVPVLLGKG